VTGTSRPAVQHTELKPEFQSLNRLSPKIWDGNSGFWNLAPCQTLVRAPALKTGILASGRKCAKLPNSCLLKVCLLKAATEMKILEERTSRYHKFCAEPLLYTKGSLVVRKKLSEVPYLNIEVCRKFPKLELFGMLLLAIK
jgi:hypothetical protein